MTLEYPEKKLAPPENFRGKPVVKGCIGCTTCVRVCPTGAITMTKEDFKIDLKNVFFAGIAHIIAPKELLK